MYKIYYGVGGSGREEKDTKQMIEFIKERFNNEFEEIIGGGGHGYVLKVKDYRDNKFKAYKITDSELDEEVEEVIKIFQDTKFGIGLTKLYEVYTIHPWRFTILGDIIKLMGKEENKKFAKYLFFRPNYTVEEMNELVKDDPEIKKIYPKHWMFEKDEEYRSEESIKVWNAQIMEFLDGDVEKLMKTGKRTTDFDIMYLCIIRNIFELIFGIICNDSHKANNQFIKEISEGDEINGVNLLNYDFWKLRLAGDDYYFPNQRHIIKFGDYDEWMVNWRLNSTVSKQENMIENIQNMLDLPLVNSYAQNAILGFEKLDGKKELTKTIKWFGIETSNYEKYKTKPDSSKTVFSFF